MIDMLEESAMMRRPVVVSLSDGRVFEDRVKEIVKWEGEDHAVFKDHELTPLSAIRTIQRGRPPELTYAGKHGTAGMQNGR
ncbi:MAG TPA: hypothetical protein VMZ53_12170 [Kofleriaceae bacterium]|nr:hypothetical protein [Kofleriaceae bacterium]